MSTMLDRLLAALQRHPEVHDWTVRTRRSVSTQLFVIGRQIESEREVATEELELSVYNDHPRPASRGGRGGSGANSPDTARGVASLKLVAGDADRLEERVDEAVLMARLVHNPPYTLPGPAPYPEVALADPDLATAGGRSRAVQEFAEQLWELVAAEPGVRLSAAEVFVTYSQRELRTSRGIVAAGDATRVMTELTLLAGQGAGQGDQEAEHFRTVEARRMAGLRLEHHVPEAAAFARDTLRATVPQTRAGTVVLAGQALAPLFRAFSFQASASAAYSKLVGTEVGKSVFGDRELRGERLTLRSNALLPFGLRSYAFDSDGVPGRDTLLIQDGILRARQASPRYAQYLSLPVTGEPAMMQVPPGDTPLEALLAPADGPLYYVLAFSAPDVDPVTGDFGSEIRLGYEITAQGRRPIKGGSAAGNVFDAFAAARFSRETMEQDEYAGPEAVRFTTLRVSGE